MEDYRQLAEDLVDICHRDGFEAYLRELGERSHWVHGQEVSRRHDENDWLKYRFGPPPVIQTKEDQVNHLVHLFEEQYERFQRANTFDGCVMSFLCLGSGSIGLVGVLGALQNMDKPTKFAEYAIIGTIGLIGAYVSQNIARRCFLEEE